MAQRSVVTSGWCDAEMNDGNQNQVPDGNVLEKLRNFVGLFDGSPYQEGEFDAAFQNSFHRDASVLAYPVDTPITDLSDPARLVEFEAENIFYHVCGVYATNRIPVELLLLERTGEEGEDFKCVVQTQFDGHSLQIQYKVKTRAGKVARLERENTVMQVTENLKNFYALFDGTTKYERSKFSAAYEKIFDKDLAALVYPVGSTLAQMNDENQRIVLGYNETYEEAVFPYAMDQSPVELVGLEPLGDGMIHYTISREQKGHIVTVKYHAQSRNGVVLRCKAVSVSLNKMEKRRASGTTRLLKEMGVTLGSIRLSTDVLPLPLQVNGKLLCEGTDLVPCEEEGAVVKVLLERSKRGFCARKGNIILKTVDGEPYAGGATIFDFRRPCKKAGGFVLKDKHGHSVALCQQSRPNLNTRAYSILGRKPLLSDGATTAQTQGNLKFYPWFRIMSYGMGPFENRAISVWNGKEYEPLLKVKVASATVDKIVISPLHRGADGHPDYAVLQCVRGWEATIAPGVDPALVLCTAAIMEDFVGSAF